MRVFLLFLFFLFISALLIVSNGNLHLKDKAEAMQFGRLYYSWIVDTTGNLFKATAYVVKFEWLPSQNSSIPQS